MPEGVRTKLCFEELLDKFKQSAETWLQETPEARGLMLVIDWKVGKDDFPPCTVVSEKPTEQSTLDMLRQSLRLTEHLSNMFRNQIDQVNSTLKQAQSIIQKQQKASLTQPSTCDG